MEPGNAIWNTFFEECDEQLAVLAPALARLRDGTQTADCIDIAFRAVHSIKGGGGIFGLTDMVAFAQIFETTLGFWRDGRLTVDPALRALACQAADTLAALTLAARNQSPSDSAAVAAVAALLAAVNDGVLESHAAPAQKPIAAAAPPMAESVWQIGFKPVAISPGTGHEIGLLLQALGNMGQPQVTVDGAPVDHLAEIDAPRAGQQWNVVLRAACDEAALRDIFAFTDDEWNVRIDRAPPAESPLADSPPADSPLADSPIAAAAPVAPQPPPEPQAPPAKLPALASPAPPAAPPDQAAAAHAAHKTVRVDLDRVDRMIDLVGELVINGSMLGQKLVTAGVSKTPAVALAMHDLEGLTREIQDTVMLIRAQPVRAVFQRMTRLVRDVSAQTGKPARLITAGDDTELDQTVIERIGAPLTQLIRNAIDHGLEDAATRRAADKPEEGVISLRAMHRSGRIVLEVADDGAGLNRARIRAKAIERGLVPADQALTNAEIDELIFLPGFSTANADSKISGGGEGMDDVRRSVQALGGRISVAARPGAGACFTMSLPLTLAVLDGMVVECGGQTIIVPLAAITETLTPRAAQVHDIDESMQVLGLRGGFVPLVDVALKLGYAAHPKDPVGAVVLLVETERGAAAALLVDRIIEQRQVVVKRLETNFGPVPCIAAATVLGDGRVALILDVEAVTPAAGRLDPNHLMTETMQAEAA